MTAAEATANSAAFDGDEHILDFSKLIKSIVLAALWTPRATRDVKAWPIIQRFNPWLRRCCCSQAVRINDYGRRSFDAYGSWALLFGANGTWAMLRRW